jgi:hypothetical protein
MQRNAQIANKSVPPSSIGYPPSKIVPTATGFWKPTLDACSQKGPARRAATGWELARNRHGRPGLFARRPAGIVPGRRRDRQSGPPPRLRWATVASPATGTGRLDSTTPCPCIESETCGPDKRIAPAAGGESLRANGSDRYGASSPVRKDVVDWAPPGHDCTARARRRRGNRRFFPLAPGLRPAAGAVGGLSGAAVVGCGGVGVRL